MINPQRQDYHNTPLNPARPQYGYAPQSPTVPPLVTIITPFYNVEAAQFAETTHCVQQQSLQQWEWLIINDGSTDPASLAALEPLRHADARIRVLDQPENRGLSAARNRGFQQARTEFIALLDGDDLLEPTALEKWYWFLLTHPQAGFTKGYAVGFGSQHYILPYGFEQGAAFLVENQVDPLAMVRRAVWQRVGGFEAANRGGLEDWEFWLRCAAHGLWGATVPEYLSWYRRRADHGARWLNWSSAARRAAFRAQLRRRYPWLYRGDFPAMPPSVDNPARLVSAGLPGANRLQPRAPERLLQWHATAAEAQQAMAASAPHPNNRKQLTICLSAPTPRPQLAELASLTPDIFCLPHFLPLADFPRFLRYLLESRQITQLQYGGGHFEWQLLPFLRAYCPQVRFVRLPSRHAETGPPVSTAWGRGCATAAIEFYRQQQQSAPCRFSMARRRFSNISRPILHHYYSQRILVRLRKFIKYVGFELAPRYKFLYRFRQLGKRILGEPS